jgi:lipoprotein-anchoring transpeptidase ErfK/SrfK
MSSYAAEHKRDKAQVEEATRLQIFLDHSNFGPGKIDGKEGEFTKKAVAAFKRSLGQTDFQAPNSKIQIDTSGLDLSVINQVFTTYVVAKEDIENVGELPSDLAVQAKMKWLPYSSLAETIAEKFHCDIDFLKELNPAVFATLKEGDVVTVPNVTPFEINSIKTLQLNPPAARTVAKEKDSSAREDVAPQISEQPPLSVFISTRENMLEVYAGEKLIAAFPVTVGSEQTSSPLGQWTVKAVVKLPSFRYDLKMLKEGERSSTFHMLPPGPNNPVGVIWVALDKEGIGIHGTSDPDLIGRTASHGCIRLANWDVAKLAALVAPGVPVIVE